MKAVCIEEVFTLLVTLHAALRTPNTLTNSIYMFDERFTPNIPLGTTRADRQTEQVELKKVTQKKTNEFKSMKNEYFMYIG